MAAGLVGLANAWAGYRLPVALANTTQFEAFERDRRLATVPHKDRVKLLAFGNSHALAAFRPLQLAEALNQPPEAVYSLSVPAASMTETWLGAAEAWSQFPAARVALIHVDESLIVPAFEQNARLRYASRYSYTRRLHVLPWLSDTDNRAVTLLSAWLPLFDQRAAWQEAWQRDRARLLAVMANQDPPLPTGSGFALVRATAYPRGYPPVWEIPGYVKLYADLAAYKRRSQEPSFVLERAETLTRYVEAAPRGLAELEAWCRLAERQGARVVLVKLPYEPSFRRDLDTRYGARMAIYEQAVAEFTAKTGRMIVAPPGPWQSEDFYDTDHTTPAASRRIAAWLKTVLPPDSL